MLPPFARPAEDSSTRLDSLNESFTRIGRTKENSIAGSHYVPLVGVERLQELPNRATVELAIVGLHDACQAINREDPTLSTQSFIDIQCDGEGRFLVILHITNHSPLTSQIPFPADPLATG
jgi:hypothetical protein